MFINQENLNENQIEGINNKIYEENFLEEKPNLNFEDKEFSDPNNLIELSYNQNVEEILKLIKSKKLEEVK